MNFVRAPPAASGGGGGGGDGIMHKDLSSIHSKVRRNSVILAKKRALRAAAELDPKVDLQAQVRLSLNVQLKDLMRPELRERSSSPEFDCSFRGPSPQTVRSTRSPNKTMTMITTTTVATDVPKITTPRKTAGRKSVAIIVNPDGRRDQRTPNSALMVSTSSQSSSPFNRDKLSPIFDRLASPESFTGIYRRRSVIDPRTGTIDGRINHHTDLSASAQRSVGQTYTGSNNIGTDEKITDIAQIMRPWLRSGKDHCAPTTLAFSDHEVKRRATILRLKEYADVYHQGKESIMSGPADGTIKNKTGTISLAQKESCFERLSDTSLFGGIHKERFDPITKKGRGRAGRDLPAKGIGHVPGGQRIHTLSRPQKGASRLKSFYNPAPKNPNSVKEAARKEVMRQQQQQQKVAPGGGGGDRGGRGHISRSPSPLGDSFWELSDPSVDWAARKMGFQDYHTLRS